MRRELPFYILGLALSALLAVYASYLAIFLMGRVVAVSNEELYKTPELRSFNFEKYAELRLR